MKLVVLIFLTFLPASLLGKRPNIVFIFSDDHATKAIGAYEGLFASLNPTPNIDKLAAQGALFKNSYCTNSICGPSRAVILTGKHSHKNGFMANGDHFNGDQQTLPKLLQQAGYQTAIFGKWHLHSTPQGFNTWKILPGQGEYYNPRLITAEGEETHMGYCTDIVTDLAVDWMKEQSKQEKPFFLMCQHKAPHRNWMPALRHLPLYEDITIPEPSTLFDKGESKTPNAQWQEMEIGQHMDLNFDLFYKLTPEYKRKKSKHGPDRSGHKNMKRMTATQLSRFRAHYDSADAELEKLQLNGEDLIRWKYQRYLKNYLRCVKGVDESVGTILETIQQLGLEEDTIVIYSSDQGFYLGDHGWYDKRWMYEESLEMPLIVKWPGVTKPGSKITELVQNLDYAPTLLEAAEAEIPADLQGKSLTSLFRGETASWRDSIYYHYYAYPAAHQVPRHNGVRTKTHKLIHFYNYDEWELYDLENDPEELQNLYQDPNQKEKIAELKKQLKQLEQNYDDDSKTEKYSPEKVKSLRNTKRRYTVPNKF